MNRGGVWRLLRELRLRAFGPEKQQVGVDHLGNKYFRIPKHETWAGHIIPERRFMEAVDIKEYEYELGDIPIEWEAWIRKRRNDPPTIEVVIHFGSQPGVESTLIILVAQISEKDVQEILKNENYKEEMKKKIKDFYDKDRLLQANDYEEGFSAEPVQTQIKGHASAHHYGKDEPSEDPVSTANTFQPGSWVPPQAHGHKK